MNEKLQTHLYFGYKIKECMCIEIEPIYGQFDIYWGERKIKYPGFRITKGRRVVGQAINVDDCKILIKKDRKSRSKKYLHRIEVLKKKGRLLYLEGRRREKSKDKRIQKTAYTFYNRASDIQCGINDEE